MEIDEIIFRVKKNKMPKAKAVTFISDFLGTTKTDAKAIYEEYIGSGSVLDKKSER